MPAGTLAAAQDAVASRIDFAEIASGKLLVYGWIVNFATAVRSATIHLGLSSIDLAGQAIRVPRPDVAKHFAFATGNDDHGFYALFDLPPDFAGADLLYLRIELASGQVVESRWPVVSHDTPGDVFREPFLTTLSQLLKKLPKSEARRLIDFAGPSMKLRTARQPAKALPPPAEFAIDLCCLLDRRALVVAGWRVDPFEEATAAELRVGDSAWPLWEGAIFFERADVQRALIGHKRRKAAELPGFLVVHEVSPEDADADEAAFVFAVGEDTVRLTHALSCLPHEGRRDFLSFFGKLEPDMAIALSKRVASAFPDAAGGGRLASLLELAAESAIEGLSSSIHNSSPRYVLHIDQAIPVADSGIFITGWFNSGFGVEVDIVCHHGGASFNVGGNWFRHPRADVSAHLANLGIQPADHAHGFTCYVPLGCESFGYAQGPGAHAPCYISVTAASGKSRHLRFAVAEPPDRAAQTIRSLLVSFHAGHPELRSLLDRQIGPAVTAAWSAAAKPPRTPVVRAYGAVPDAPAVSILVPLYGRHDFAAYQLALFADDPDFQGAKSMVELIYVVDDPSILADFTRACDDLLGLYEVPFLVASCGANLGFSGANNLGAAIARGKYLLFLNSDVMPSRAGWVGDLLRVYESLPNPGLLGAKLLYEDGSVQHAGIAFRRHPAWGGLWINDHPFKGQSPLGLRGVRQVEAVTAACALADAAIFRQAGGFSEDYIIGDFEDTDLCLRLEAAGRASFVVLDVDLYHLERQSQNRLNDMNWRVNLTLYNCWLHDSRWGGRIASRAGEVSRVST